MKQSEFVQINNAYWKQSEQDLTENNHLLELPETYRTLSQHLSIARTRGYSPELIRYLQKIVLEFHRRLYHRKDNWFLNIWSFFRLTFPLAVKKNQSLFYLSSVLFFLPMILTALFVYLNPDSAYNIISFEQIADIKEMYDPQNRELGRQRGDGGDWYMFGFYLYNNTSIGFRTFAAGLLLGFGSAFLLLFNAIFIGLIAGYLINIGYSDTFFSFVSGHSSFELLAIVLSGVSGFIIGNALIKPANLTRRLALQNAAKQAMPIMQGAMSFFFVAAIIEAFWSSSILIPFTVKISVGVILWLILLYYLLVSHFRLRLR